MVAPSACRPYTPPLMARIVATLLLALQVTSTAQPDYRSLVDDYRHYGAEDVRRLLEVPRDTVKGWVSAASRDGSEWTWGELRAAAILHTDAALRLIEAKDLAGAEMHLDSAQHLLERVAKVAPAQNDYAWRWYKLMPSLLKKVGGGGLSKRLDAYADLRWGRNAARAALLRGIDLEARGNREGRIPRPGETALLLAPESLQSPWFAAASEAFSAALREDAGLHAARVHLGRIRMIQGKRAEAAALLRPALDDVDPAVVYLAALFLGSIEERDDHFDSAESLYRKAASVVPYGQSAPLALAELLSRTGREDEARKVMAATLAPQTRFIEPLWAYAARLDEELGARFELLRAEVWR